MSNVKPVEATRNFIVSSDVFDHPGLDIYAQMVCIVLQYHTSESAIPTLDRVAKDGRMTTQQATRALQSLVDLKILSHKLFRQIVGEFTDDRLSWAAKGLFAYCKDHPHLRLSDLVTLCSQSGEDEQSLRRALRELDQYGYLDELAELKKAIS